MSYDEKCEELARYFLPEGSHAEYVRQLAQVIQDAIEQEMEIMAEAESGESHL